MKVTKACEVVNSEQEPRLKKIMKKLLQKGICISKSIKLLDQFVKNAFFEKIGKTYIIE